ncbi:MAG: hypothetical protein HZB10_03040 [Candidatus Yonathbacteria bacterium]|nr:hypothetical protein [Candidatus Yonathbacteria bacterium]
MTNKNCNVESVREKKTGSSLKKPAVEVCVLVTLVIARMCGAKKPNLLSDESPRSWIEELRRAAAVKGVKG